jgi:hypothetical protein
MSHALIIPALALQAVSIAALALTSRRWASGRYVPAFGRGPMGWRIDLLWSVPALLSIGILLRVLTVGPLVADVAILTLGYELVRRQHNRGLRTASTPS